MTQEFNSKLFLSPRDTRQITLLTVISAASYVVCCLLSQ